MANVGGQISFRYGPQSNYDGCPSIDPNAMYVTDEGRIFLGETECTHPVPIFNSYGDMVASVRAKNSLAIVKEEDGTYKLYHTVDGNSWVSIDTIGGVGSEYDGPGTHNCIYRGKYLGDEVTPEQYDAIADGTFRDMYIGDYWYIDGITYRIAAFDYYSGDMVTDGYKQDHHVTIVPDFFSSEGVSMNATQGDDVSRGYLGSSIVDNSALQSYMSDHCPLRNALQRVVSHFGKNHIMCYHPLLIAGYTASGGFSQMRCWRFIDLMSEQQVMGSRVCGMVAFGLLNRVGTVDYAQFPLFAFRPDLIVCKDANDNKSMYEQGKRYSYWLRDIASPAGFCTIAVNGEVAPIRASLASTIRPFFSIVKDNSAAVRVGQGYGPDYGGYGLIGELMTFYIDGKAYQAVWGSTWCEWGESEYNVDRLIPYKTDYVFDSTMNQVVYDANNTIVHGEDKILPSHKTTYHMDV